MKRVADGLYLVTGFPPNAINVCRSPGPPFRDTRRFVEFVERLRSGASL
jgi:hypothetical protein